MVCSDKDENDWKANNLARAEASELESNLVRVGEGGEDVPPSGHHLQNSYSPYFNPTYISFYLISFAVSCSNQ